MEGEIQVSNPPSRARIGFGDIYRRKKQSDLRHGAGDWR
jgi:hypothetical protein